MYKEILKKIKLKKIKICVVGLGYVGLPLAIRLIKSNVNVFGYDTDKKKIDYLKNGKSYISNISNNELIYFKKNKKNLFRNISNLKKIDVFIVCLPTPLSNNNKPEMKYVHNFFESLRQFIHDGQVFILESTVYPGASLEIINKLNLKQKILNKKNFFIFSPEREDPGNTKFSYKFTPKVVSGFTKECLKIGKKIYSLFVKKTVSTTSLEVAETSKLLENIFRSVNIGLINEFKIICKKMNINIYDVIDVAATKNFGFMKFYPGPGLGGHCIPIDPFYLSWASKKKGYDPKFIKLSGYINKNITSWVLKNILNYFLKKKINYKNKKILIIGIAYKKNVDDDRETPAYYIMNKLLQKNIKIQYHDPYIKKIRKGRKFKNLSNFKSIELSKKNIQNSLAAIILTDHDEIDYNKIRKYSNLIFDTRGKYKKTINENIIQL